MTRFLSESLSASEPYFQMELRKLERAHGNPAADIRLSAHVQEVSRTKIKELGLDPRDTTGKELYMTILERVKADDRRLIRALQTRSATYVSAEADVVAGMVHALRDLPVPQTSLALKTTKFKTLIKKNPPKKAMKQLGYRSLESYLKHETPALIMAAAKLCENQGWHRNFVDSYKKLKPSDFESRRITIAHPNNKRWQELAQASVERAKHNVLSFPEIGSIIILPLPSKVPAGVTTASLVFALNALNDLRASSTFLKLSMMRRDFGTVVQNVSSGKLELDAQMLDRSVPWHIIQRYYARWQHLFRDELFEPHIQIDDMAWPAIEHMMGHIAPALEFWHDSAALGILFDHQPISLNVVDAALNLCNQVPFERRIVRHFQQSLWHEVVLKYLRHDTVEESVATQLQPQLRYVAAIN